MAPFLILVVASVVLRGFGELRNVGFRSFVTPVVCALSGQRERRTTRYSFSRCAADEFVAQGSDPAALDDGGVVDLSATEDGRAERSRLSTVTQIIIAAHARSTVAPTP